MLMMFSQALRGIPLERCMPFNNDDLLIMMDNNIAFALTNIITDEDKQFSTRYIMENQAVFSCPNFKDRMMNFTEIMSSRLERFFDTNKVDYIFFDLEEQKFIKSLFNKQSLSCVVNIYLITPEGFKETNLEDIPISKSRKVLAYLSQLKVRTCIDTREYYNLKSNFNKRAKSANENFKKRASKMGKISLDIYFKRYSKLMMLDEQTKVDKYFKLLKKKYHPDIGGNEDIFKTINDDHAKIKESFWYKRLK